MKKIVLGVFCLLLLTGCQNANESLTTLAGNVLLTASQSNVRSPIYHHGYYSYYCSPAIGKVQETQTSNTFNYNGDVFVMNLDIQEIMAEKFTAVQESSSSTENKLVDISGQCETYDAKTITYQATVYETGQYYYLSLAIPYVNFYAFAQSKTQVSDLLREMLKIARTVSVDKEEVLADYNSQETISYTRKKVDLFEDVIPVDGVVDELLDLDSNLSIGSTYEGDNYGDEETGEDEADSGNTGTIYQSDDNLDDYIASDDSE